MPTSQYGIPAKVKYRGVVGMSQLCRGDQIMGPIGGSPETDPGDPSAFYLPLH